MTILLSTKRIVMSKYDWRRRDKRRVNKMDKIGYRCFNIILDSVRYEDH